ncbi:MAG: 50S ribosomal protein L9 [Ilumatobacteraceae bacterium]
MQVLLRSDVAGVGRRGDIVNVSSGHARNFLLPNGLAVVASEGTVRQSDSMKKARQQKEAADRETATNLIADLGKRQITVTAKAGNEGRLFGSVSAADVAAAIAAQTGASVDRKAVVLGEPIRAVGEHQVTIDMHGVSGTVTVSVVAG